MSEMQWNKSSETSATPFFDSQRVTPGTYPANPGSVNAARPSPAGGEVRPDAMGPRTNLVGDSPVRR
jgi:hypothetical protein